MALQAQRSTSYALTGLLEAEVGWDVLVPPVGSSLGDGSDVALFGGEVVLATASTHDDSEGLAVSARLSASDRSWRTSPAVTSSQPPGMG